MKPLEGIKIVDFTQAHAGSLATMILADFGAEIIKIERAGVGDLARYWAPMKDDNSGYYAYLNRGKKSVSINAAKEEGLNIVKKLIAEADVITENFKYGSMDRMGLSYEDVMNINPSIIYASLNGFGQTGPMKKTIGLDLQLQAMSGIMDLTGFLDGEPTKAGVALADQLSGVYMAIGILLALIDKVKTNEGQKIDIAILDSLVSVLESAPVSYSMENKTTKRNGNGSELYAPYDMFKTKDGMVALGIKTDDQWVRFCSALSLTNLLSDDKYLTNDLRCENYNLGLKSAIENLFINMEKYELEKLLQESNVPCGVLRTVQEAMQTNQIKKRMLVSVDDNKLGKIEMIAPLIKLEKTAAKIESGAPMLGEHTASYLNEIGYSDYELEELVKAKIVEIV